ncbi:MAG TPA: MBL fold metallo-hydrolase [Polyangia bacterium]|jgi:Predicted Zn-dependent hydrolases of the beta-lactamase fold|nr:MBL fold metallo-hydrolase [Polyangia bacterium]
MKKPRRSLLLALLAGVALAGSYFAAHAAPRPVAYLTWYGQSCFLLESATGTRVVMDPIPSNIGYLPSADLHADAVTVSHEHQDHNNVALVRGKPKILRGLTPDKKGWMRIDEKVKDIAIRSVGVYHDNKKGAEIGLNTVFVFEVGGVRIAHLGDLGHLLTDQQISAIGSVDVVLVPVGGVWTVDALKATQVIDQIRPRLVAIPMHYRTELSTIKELATVDGFLAGRSNVRRETGTRLAITGLRSRPSAETVVLRYQ